MLHCALHVECGAAAPGALPWSLMGSDTGDTPLGTQVRELLERSSERARATLAAAEDTADALRRDTLARADRVRADRLISLRVTREQIAGDLGLVETRLRQYAGALEGAAHRVNPAEPVEA